MNETTLNEQFHAAFAGFLKDGDKDALLAFLHEDAAVILDDTPFILDAAQLRDHLAFHAGLWERHYLTLRDLRVQVFGSTGLVSANYQDRGKPRDAGYRQRDGMLALVCAWDEAAGAWRGVKLHMNTLLAAIHHSSPG